MRTHLKIWPYSGLGVLFDPAAVVFARPDEPDYQTLEDGMRAGSLLFWPADDELDVELMVDEPLPPEFADAVQVQRETTRLRAPSGRLWLADPAHIHEAHASATIPIESGVLIPIDPGEFDARAVELNWPERAPEDALRALAGRAPVRLRDVLAVVATVLGLVTLFGVPLLVGKRWGDSGWEAAAESLIPTALVLTIAWGALVWLWRRPFLRQVDEAEREVGRRFPAIAIVLTSVERRPEDS